jgi:hypothetical protein
MAISFAILDAKIAHDFVDNWNSYSRLPLLTH